MQTYEFKNAVIQTPKNKHMCQFREDGNLPWFLSFFFFFWPVATAKRTELALISQQFLKISAR